MTLAPDMRRTNGADAPVESAGSAVRWAAAGATVAMVVPWINPFALGPSPSVLPWLVSMASMACLGLLVQVRRLPMLHCIGAAWLLAALISSGLGVVQFLGLGASLAPWVNATGLGEAFGNLRQRNQFATLTNVGLVALLWSPLASMGRCAPSVPAAAQGSGHSPWASWSAATVLALGNAVSASRTGLFQLALAALVVVLSRPWRSRRNLRILGVTIVVYAFASAWMPVLIGLQPFGAGAVARLNVDGQPCGSRIALWTNVLHLIGQRPWAGWGWGNLDYAHFAAVYPGVRFCDILDNAHNLPLHLAVELGVPVAVLVCWLIGWLIVRARPWRETDDTRRMAWAVLALIGLHSLLEYPLWYGPFQMAVVLAVWILWRTRAHSLQAPLPAGADLSGVALPPAVSSPIASWVGAGSVVVLCVVAYAAWDYRRVSQIYRPPAQRASAYRDDTLAKVRDSWLFRNQVRFAELTLTRVTPENAASINRSAHALLHFSPEARVVEKLVDSALLLGRREEAVFFMRRMRTAYPEDYALWRETREPLADLPEIGP